MLWAGAILLVAASASAGRFEEFTAKAAQGEKLKTVAATYFGGPGIEEFIAAEGLPDGGLVIAGRCTPHFADLAKQAPVNATDPLTIPEDARKDLGATEHEGVKLPGDVYVAKLAADGTTFVWVHVLQGHRTPPARLFLDEKGNVTFECVTISRISADGKELRALTGRMTGGDRCKLLAVNAKDGTFLYGGEYVAVFNKDFTDLRFSSLVPGCKVQGIGLAKGGLLFASRSDGKEEAGNAPPVAGAVQGKFGGKYDGHLILLETPAAKPTAGASPPSGP